MVIASMLPLAIQHFNERKTQYVPQLSEILNCSFRLNTIAVSDRLVREKKKKKKKKSDFTNKKKKVPVAHKTQYKT